jgi:hypothetical protein
VNERNWGRLQTGGLEPGSVIVHVLCTARQVASAVSAKDTNLNCRQGKWSRPASEKDAAWPAVATCASPQTTGERGALRFVVACYAGGLQKAFNPGSGGRTYWLLLLKPAHVPLGGWCRVTVIQGGEFADTYLEHHQRGWEGGPNDLAHAGMGGGHAAALPLPSTIPSKIHERVDVPQRLPRARRRVAAASLAKRACGLGGPRDKVGVMQVG